jgi:periplasmic divalent cation tolerance protein
MSRYDGRLLIVATTFPERGAAEKIVRDLVAKGLVVCGQVGADLSSFYRWQGDLAHDHEVAVALKVRDERLQECLRILRRDHPYETPQLLAWPVAYVDDAYGRWAWEG